MTKTTKILTGIVLLLILLMIVAIVVFAFFTPRIAQLLCDRYTRGNTVALCAFMYLGEAAACWCLMPLFFIMNSVLKGQPFVRSNVRAINHMAAACALAFVDIAALLVIYGGFQFLGLICCCAILLFATLCCYVVSRVFDRAVAYKLENDLTV